MSPVPFLGERPPYRLLLSCSSGGEQELRLHLRLETRVALRLPYALKAFVHVQYGELPELSVHIHGVEPARYGQPGERPAAWEWSGSFPAGSYYGQCTLMLGRQQQRLLLRFAPPRVEVVHQYGAPIAELVLP